MSGRDCRCHAAPMLWKPNRNLRAGGRWRCAERQRDYDRECYRRRYDAPRDYSRPAGANFRDRELDRGAAYRASTAGILTYARRRASWGRDRKAMLDMEARAFIAQLARVANREAA